MILPSLAQPLCLSVCPGNCHTPEPRHSEKHSLVLSEGTTHQPARDREAARSKPVCARGRLLPPVPSEEEVLGAGFHAAWQKGSGQKLQDAASSQ